MGFFVSRRLVDSKAENDKSIVNMPRALRMQRYDMLHEHCPLHAYIYNSIIALYLRAACVALVQVKPMLRASNNEHDTFLECTRTVGFTNKYQVAKGTPVRCALAGRYHT